MFKGPFGYLWYLGERMRLAPPILRCEVRTQVDIPEARVKVVDLHEKESYEDIPLLSDPVDGLPFLPNFKRFDRAELEQMWRLLQSSMKKVKELLNFRNLWPSIPQTPALNLGHMGPVGSVVGLVAGFAPVPTWFTDITRMFSFNLRSSVWNPVSGEGSHNVTNKGPQARRQLRKR